MTTRQKIVRIISSNNLLKQVNFTRTKGYAISPDGSASYSLFSNRTYAGSKEQEELIGSISMLLNSKGIAHRVEVGSGMHKEIVIIISNPSR